MPADRLAAWAGVSPPREDLMELSLARELPSWELSTISTAASRSRHRDDSLPRISAAISWWGVPAVGWSPKRCECQEREEADTQPLRWARGLLTDTVPPALPGLKSGASRPEQRRPQRDPLLWRAGSSAVPGSNQRPGAFSPRRRDPRCWKTQPCRSQSELSSLCSALLSSCPIFRDWILSP